MNIDINVIATGLLAPIAVLVIKTMLDFKLAPLFVKYLWWLPIRGMFRDKPQNISGNWEQQWGDASSENFAIDTERHSHSIIRQFGRYCYAEFFSKGVEYRLFGKIQEGYIIGEWYDSKEGNAYFGAFQLRIVGLKSLKGKWIGHSMEKCIVQQDEWVWDKIG